VQGIRFFLSLISSQVTKDFPVIIPKHLVLVCFLLILVYDSSDRVVDVLNTRPVLQPHSNNASNIAAVREYSLSFRSDDDIQRNISEMEHRH